MSSELSSTFDLYSFLALMRSLDISRLYAKRLSPNDNSKNQIYLGGDFSALNILPTKKISEDRTARQSKRARFKADISLSWVSQNGGISPAPGSQLILYPKYPEVRLSGFLRGSKEAPNNILTKRTPGRLLLMGIKDEGTVIAAAVSGNSAISRALDTMERPKVLGVFFDLTPLLAKTSSTKIKMLKALHAIHQKGWIKSKRLDASGLLHDCNAPNCGGLTLEAELGISSNPDKKPDYLGWEVKQHNVKDMNFPRKANAITLITPNPTRGYYKEHGVEEFIRRFGYPDISGIPGRINFGGPYWNNIPYHRNNITLTLSGYNAEDNKILDTGGGIRLMTSKGELAAEWDYAELISHWNRKHALAVYVPSQKKDTPRKYRYGKLVEVAEGTDFLKFLSCLASGIVYYDPGLHVSDVKDETKERNQFRIARRNIPYLYSVTEIVNLDKI